MGSKKVIKKLRVKGTIFLLTGILLVLTSVFLLSLKPQDDGQTAAIFVAIAMLVGGAVLFYLGIDNWKGKNSSYIRNNPGILELADDLLMNPVYQDKFITISNKAIATKKDISTKD